MIGLSVEAVGGGKYTFEGSAEQNLLVNIF